MLPFSHRDRSDLGVNNNASDVIENLKSATICTEFRRSTTLKLLTCVRIPLVHDSKVSVISLEIAFISISLTVKQ